MKALGLIIVVVVVGFFVLVAIGSQEPERTPAHKAAAAKLCALPYEQREQAFLLSLTKQTRDEHLRLSPESRRNVMWNVLRC